MFQISYHRLLIQEMYTMDLLYQTPLSTEYVDWVQGGSYSLEFETGLSLAHPHTL